jgi:hypothetical protein
VDLHATRGDKTFVVEIETSKSNVTDNIKKRNGYGTLIVFFTTTMRLIPHSATSQQTSSR